MYTLEPTMSFDAKRLATVRKTADKLAKSLGENHETVSFYRSEFARIAAALIAGAPVSA